MHWKKFVAIICAILALGCWIAIISCSAMLTFHRDYYEIQKCKFVGYKYINDIIYCEYKWPLPTTCNDTIIMVNCKHKDDITCGCDLRHECETMLSWDDLLEKYISPQRAPYMWSIFVSIIFLAIFTFVACKWMS
jgi:hypothetical protein